MTDTLPERLFRDQIETPLGPAMLVTDEAERLRAFDWTENVERFERLLRRHCGDRVAIEPGRARSTRDAFERYFAGELAALDDVRVATRGTDFQRKVWAALRTIAYGETLSYGALAARIGSPKAVRAVGLANGQNPIALVVPCHRVIGADGSLTGYASGLPRKRWLLDHEARHAAMVVSPRGAIRRAARLAMPAL
ncbi:MAG TPA: methylated-DNA--[protein]-cysteine S-methyltransferase [Polyangiaceae bacterium]|jgi:methylated-DNA-[protein]-cysteine S-methyltransferase|nr:methylated-DNA--[protein]-cysteine S-methyltransferase [Polyangiaceae bacterium]